MKTGTKCGLLCIVCCVYVIPFIGQTAGFFTPMWASNATCDSMGLLYNCCNGSGKNQCETIKAAEMPSAVIFLTISNIYLLCAVVISLYTICMLFCGNEKESWLIFCAVYTVVVNPISGFFTVLGCVNFAQNVSNDQLGLSYYLCLTAGCMTFLPLALLIGFILFLCCSLLCLRVFIPTEHGSHDTSTSEQESQNNSTAQRSRDKRMTQQESHDSNNFKAKSRDRVFIRVKSYPNTGSEEPTASGCDDKKINDSIGGKLHGRLTKPFTVTSEKSVKMSNAGAKHSTSRLDTLCLEEYIINGSDAVEES